MTAPMNEYLLEHLPSEGLNGLDTARTGIAWEEFTVLLWLISTELCAALVDSTTPASASRGKGGAE